MHTVSIVGLNDCNKGVTFRELEPGVLIIREGPKLAVGETLGTLKPTVLTTHGGLIVEVSPQKGRWGYEPDPATAPFDQTIITLNNHVRVVITRAIAFELDPSSGVLCGTNCKVSELGSYRPSRQGVDVLHVEVFIEGRGWRKPS